MKNNAKQTITIGISALNEERNIKQLLTEILNQDFGNLFLEKIIVVSDGSTDSTMTEAQSVKDGRVFVINGKERLGKNTRLNEIISRSTSDFLIFFDSDILIEDKFFIQKLTAPMVFEYADMTSSGIEELPPKSSFEKILYVSMKLKSILFREFKLGNNVYNCHGPAMAFAKKLYRHLEFSKNGVDDMYAYLSCKKLNMKFVYVPSAKVSYRLPSSPTDHYKQSSRYLDGIKISKKEFGKEFSYKEFHIPPYIYVASAIKALPLIFSNIFLVVLYLVTYSWVHLSKALRFKTKDTWNIGSSKILK